MLKIGLACQVPSQKLSAFFKVIVLRFCRSELALASERRGGHQDQFAEAFIGHAAEDALIQPGRLAGCRHDGWQLGIIAIVDQLVELLARPGRSRFGADVVQNEQAG